MSFNGIYIENLKKSYHGFTVLDIENLSMELGKAYGLIGTNGAGKTTLLRILSGLLSYDKGIIKKNNFRFEMIHHKTGLFEELTIYENVYMNREVYKGFGPLRRVDWKKVKKRSKQVLEEAGLDLDIELPVKKLDSGTKKVLEIVIAISRDPDVLLIDEPLTLLDHKQIDFLNKLLKEFIKNDKMIIYSSHRMNELLYVVDEVITLKEGKVVQRNITEDFKDENYAEFSERDVHRYPKRKVKKGEVLLKVENLETKHINKINFELYEGEILGIVGLKGSYKSDIGKALFGYIPSKGRTFVSGYPRKLKTTYQSVEAGICYLGSGQEGMFLEDTVFENVVSANAKRARRLSRSAKKLISKHYLDLLNVDGDQFSGLKTLSTGNKQKILLAKWFFSNSKVFIFNEPTAHIDVPSKVDIYNIFSDLAETKAGIIMISNNLEEVAGLSDRVLVIDKKGKVQTKLLRKDLSVQRLVEVLQGWNEG
ncbi:MAG: ATP-binding cassette domain-containing protein [Eubacteriales bacterium]